MSQAAAAQEPTMEEILASIRRIISDEEGDASDDAMEPQAVAEMASALEEAFVGKHDLDSATADIAFEDEHQAAAAEVDDMSIDDMDIDALMAEEPVAAEEPAPEPEAEPTAAMNEPVEEHVFPQALLPETAPAPTRNETATSLMSSTTSDEATAAFGKLSHLVMSQNARTLDDIVTEMMRPMLRDWIDDNLPPLVERLVQDEIKRISRGG